MTKSSIDRTTPEFLLHLPGPLVKEAREPVAKRLLSEYGAIFAAGGGAVPPDSIVFKNEDQVSDFQSSVKTGVVRFADITIELQAPAAKALAAAAVAADAIGLKVSPRGADSGKRSYASTVDLWLSRVEPALVYWIGQGRLTYAEAERVRSLSPTAQVPEVFALEEQGIFFAKDLSKSIIFSVAPPGASQHLSMLAFDVAEFDDKEVREVLAQNYWYQTVTSDLPHFTFLGVSREELPARGLKAVTYLDREFWIPDI